MPALDTTMSTPPKRRTASPNAATTEASSTTFMTTPWTTSLPWLRARSDTACCREPASTSARVTQAPSARSRSAAARPMPPAPPVMKAMRPARLLGFGMRCSLASSSSQYSMSNASCSGRLTYRSKELAPRMTLIALT